MKEKVIKEKINGVELSFYTTPGVFSWQNLDEGTRLLLAHLSVSEKEEVLDVGCGYGPLGIYCAKKATKGKVLMVDKDFVAVDYAKKNILLNNLSNSEAQLSNVLTNIDINRKFTLIVSNLPANVGKDVWDLLLDQAKQALEPNGRIIFVTIANLKDYVKRKFTEIFGNYEKIAHDRRYIVHQASKE